MGDSGAAEPSGNGAWRKSDSSVAIVNGTCRPAESVGSSRQPEQVVQQPVDRARRRNRSQQRPRRGVGCRRDGEVHVSVSRRLITPPVILLVHPGSSQQQGPRVSASAVGRGPARSTPRRPRRPTQTRSRAASAARAWRRVGTRDRRPVGLDQSNGRCHDSPCLRSTEPWPSSRSTAILRI
jgi:hypothetical protein